MVTTLHIWTIHWVILDGINIGYLIHNEAPTVHGLTLIVEMGDIPVIRYYHD